MTAMPALDRRSDYVSAVAVELADLAPDDRGELIEELDDHVAALLEDRPDADLVAELGTPRAYAAELRTAAGLAGDGPAPEPLLHRLHDHLVRLDARVPAGLRTWLGALRPTWWVLRGYLIVAGAFYLMHQTWANSGMGVVFPAPEGNWFLGVVAVVLGAAVSVRIGTWRGLSRPASWCVAVALAALAFWSAFSLAATARDTYPVLTTYQTEYVSNCPIELDNLYAYDAAGKPVAGARLYDQNGNPFDLSVFGCGDGRFTPGAGAANAYPWPSAQTDPNATPTGPPASVSPLPGATVTPAAPKPTPTASNPTPAATR